MAEMTRDQLIKEIEPRLDHINNASRQIGRALWSMDTLRVPGVDPVHQCGQLAAARKLLDDVSEALKAVVRG